MANNTNMLQTIPLEGEVCLNRLDSEIRQFQGFREMNSPLNGDVLTPYHKKEQIADKTLAFDDDGNSYELQNGLLFKNGVKVEPEVNLGGSLKEELFDAGSPIVYADDARMYCENWYWEKNAEGEFEKKLYPTDEKVIAAKNLFFVSFNYAENKATLRTVESDNSIEIDLNNISEICVFVSKVDNDENLLLVQVSKKGLFRPNGEALFKDYVYNKSAKTIVSPSSFKTAIDENILIWYNGLDSAPSRVGDVIRFDLSNKNELSGSFFRPNFENGVLTFGVQESEFTYVEAFENYNNSSVFISDDLVWKLLPMRDRNNAGEIVGEDTIFVSQNNPYGGVSMNSGYKVYGSDPLRDTIGIYWSEAGLNGSIYRDGVLIGALLQIEIENYFLLLNFLCYDFYSVYKKFGKNVFVLNNSKNILRTVVKSEGIEENVFNGYLLGITKLINKTDFNATSNITFYNIDKKISIENNALKGACNGCHLGSNSFYLEGNEISAKWDNDFYSRNTKQWKLFTSSYNPFFNYDDPFFGVQYNPQLIYGNYATPENAKDKGNGLSQNILGLGESVFYSDPDDKKGGSFVATFRHIGKLYSYNPFNNKNFDPAQGDLAGLPWPQSSEAGLLLPLSYFAIKNIKKTFTGRDYLFDDNKAFELKYSGTTQFFGYDLLAGIDQVEDVFFLQGQPYCISNNAIFSFSVFNSQLQNISPIVSIYGLDYVANNGIIALFFSKFNRTFYAFNGSNQLILVKEANEIEDVVKSDYNTATKDIVFLAKNELGKGGVWVLRDNMSMHNIRENEIIDDFRLTTKDIVTTQKKIIDGVEKTSYTLYSLFDEEPTREPIHLKTNFYGSSENRLSKFDCFYFWLYKEKITVDGLLKVKIETITNLTKQTFEKVFNIRQSDFDQDGKMLVKWAPQYQSAVGCSLEVNSDFPIYSIQVSVTDQGVNTLTRFNG